MRTSDEGSWIMGRGVVDRRSPGGDVLVRLVGEFGRAAREGWGPTVRWVVLLVAVAGAVALLLVAGR
jgi:hypothetical protein